MRDDAVLYEADDDHIVTLTLNRPAARNAVNGDVARMMEEGLDRFEADDDARVAIITGAGPVFCAGADLKEVASGNARSISTKRGGFAGLVVRERTKPLIAAVNGTAVAGGCEILLACDMAVVAEGVMIGVPEVKRSLVAAAGALWRLPRAVGPARAAEMALTGDPITADAALAAGLINAVVPAGEVMNAARALAARVSVNAPLAVQASRTVLTKAFEATEQELYRASNQAIVSLMDTEDFAEGPRAFIEKRPPVWKGR
jgi:enoyl-CoA hydratase